MGCGSSTAAAAPVSPRENVKRIDIQPQQQAPPPKPEPKPVAPGGPLMQPGKVGGAEVRNRIFMAPMTRQHASMKHVPQPIMAKYYSQRAAHAGLVVTESNVIAPDASAVFADPGLYNAEQVEGWRQVTKAVHAKGGRIFAQLAHYGRTSHQINGDDQEDVSNNAQPVAPSAVAITQHGMSESSNPLRQKLSYQKPRELAEAEIPDIIALFVTAAKNAMDAGFDGVEIHGGNGFLIDQFWRSSANRRAEGRYSGATVESRSQFALDVVAAVAGAVGAGKVGIRISPLNSFNEMSDAEPERLTRYLCSKLNDLHIAYVHVMRGDFFGVQTGNAVAWVREAFKGFVIGNMGYEIEEAQQAIENGEVDAVAFGTHFVANPDLPIRVLKKAPLAVPDRAKFYGAGDENEDGYTSYPELAA